MLPKEFLQQVVTYLENHKETFSKDDFSKEKRRLAIKHALGKIPTDMDILTQLEQREEMKSLLLSKPVRSMSGVQVVAIMTKPSRCPHGRCTYCPGGIGSAFGDVPQSYTGNEPASMRGARADYDAYVQVFNRLEQYVVAGHDPQKVELIIMGGTFPHEPEEYKEAFVRDAFQALNDFSALFFNGDQLKLEEFKSFFQLPGNVKDIERTTAVKRRILEHKQQRSQSLEEVQEENETTYARCVGLTIETRPSHGKLAHGNEMLRFGCTRVELGVQTTFDDVLHAVHRDHTVQDSIESIADLRDLGFKLNFHIMLGLPRMTKERDLEAAQRMFHDPDFLPDMVKLYPCMVMPGTPLEVQYKRGDFTPITTEQAADLICDIIPMVPSWCRIMRVQRDIPTKVTEAGVDRTNLRQVVDQKMHERNIVSKDIRAREIGNRSINKAVLNVQHYEASHGEEYFISIDDPSQDSLLGFCRLRFPARQLREEFTIRTAIIRELHVYGQATNRGVIGIAAQHKGYGGQLLHVAERIAKENGKQKLLVISGVGVREYYRKHGYTREGPYMAKTL